MPGIHKKFDINKQLNKDEDLKKEDIHDNEEKKI